MCTSRRFLGRTVNGLMSGSVGCSNRRISVRVSSLHRSCGFCLVGMESGNVNVPLGSRDHVFRGCRHTSTTSHDHGNNTSNFKLNLGCIFHITRTRNKGIYIRDVRKRCDRFFLFLPDKRGGWVFFGRRSSVVGLLLIRSSTGLYCVVHNKLRSVVNKCRIVATSGNRRKLGV